MHHISKLIELLRSLLAIRLDETKFADLLKGNRHSSTQLRKYVYHKILQYKAETAVELPLVTKLLSPISQEFDIGVNLRERKQFIRLRNSINKKNKK